MAGDAESDRPEMDGNAAEARIPFRSRPLIQPGLRLRPLKVTDVLDESFRLYRNNFPVFAGVSLAASLPIMLVTLLAGTGSVYGAMFTAFTNPGALGANGPPSTNPWWTAVELPVTLALAPFQYGAVVLVAISAVLGTPVTVLSVIRSVLGRYWALVLLYLVYLLLGVALICLPLGIWLGVRLAPAVPVLLTERVGVGAALDRSWRLMTGNFWRVFACLALVLLMVYVLQWALLPLFLGVAGLAPGLPADVRGDLAIVSITLAGQLMLPFYAIALVLVYFDLRVRKEAFDLELLAYQIRGARSSAPQGEAAG
jgi:hypothetical protein